MKVLLISIGIFFLFILAIICVFFIIYLKAKNTLKKNGINLKSELKNSVNYERQEYSRIKDVRGLTTMLEPLILEDFSNFNKELMYSLCERNLRKVFNCIEEKNYDCIKNDDDFIYLKSDLKSKIDDMNSNGSIERFDNVEFNRHAIYRYIKEKGKATIKISSSVSYYYETNIKNRKSFPNILKQTRYTSEFVYVYDESKFISSQTSFSIHCPNCGAPVKKINREYCEYCGNHIEPINLKTWKMSSYSEDYK